MIIRRETREDFNSIYEINKQAFKQENESKLIERIRANKNFIPKLSLVAEENRKIILRTPFRALLNTLQIHLYFP